MQPESEFTHLEEISSEINSGNNDLEPYESSEEILMGAILAAPYYDCDPRQTEYFRAKVLFPSDSETNDKKFMVND